MNLCYDEEKNNTAKTPGAIHMMELVVLAFFFIDLTFFQLKLSKMLILSIIAMAWGFWPHIK